ncbi:MAG: hypothetical protein JWQ25_2281 [Daejeonella sp.]|nr:hypothetical protein [Daejeonella sp.]
MKHTFHIPVLGLGYSIDTPLKVAHYGISSTVSIVDDHLIERMRAFHAVENDKPFTPIHLKEEDHRAKRITAYLNLLSELVDEKFENLKQQSFEDSSDLRRYFELLPANSDLFVQYKRMQSEADDAKKLALQSNLKTQLTKGSIDANIMSKVDKINFDLQGDNLGEKFSDALASLRGFAESNLDAAIIMSAGLNPRLYSYLEEFPDFFPCGDEQPKKKIILKVSDFRSAFIQAKFLAKKGLWVHEFRIESGLNCGGHAFATEGYLLGPILEEFKQRRQQMTLELFESYRSALQAKNIVNTTQPITRFTVQGGIGTADENNFLTEYYELDGTGWGSPFLLVPEATNVDTDTLELLSIADESDYYVSGSSPLGIPFNNFRKSSCESQRLERIAKGRPGSPCTKKFLVSNTEFTEKPICTASREYQKLKLQQLDDAKLPEVEHLSQFNAITEKVCLCQGLSSAAYIKNDILKPRENKAVTICPGPNTAYFNRIYSLDEMVSHIYGKVNLLSGINRPSLFINELKLYVEYFKKDFEASSKSLTAKKAKQLEKFKAELLNGIEYYGGLLKEFKSDVEVATNHQLNQFREQLSEMFVVAEVG